MLLFQTNGWEVFTPDLGDLWVGLGGSLFLFLALAIGGFILYGRKSEDARVKVVLPMLLYMGALLALVSAGGHLLTSMKYPEISISKTRLAVDGKEYPRPRRDALRIETVDDRLTREQNQILLLKLGDGKTLALPDNRYPLEKMIKLLEK